MPCRQPSSRELCLHGDVCDLPGPGNPRSSLSVHGGAATSTLTAPKLQEPVDRGLAGKILAEKQKAVADWKEVERMSREIGLNNAADQEFLEVSSSYGRIKMAITEQIYRMQILAALAKKTGHPDKKRMAEAIRSYDALWEEWRKLKADHKCCPTLYRDDIAQHGGPPFGIVLAEYRRMVSDSTSSTQDEGAH